jgi:hypothetical protein
MAARAATRLRRKPRAHNGFAGTCTRRVSYPASP